MDYTLLFQEIKSNLALLVVTFASFMLAAAMWAHKGRGVARCADLITAPNGRYSVDAIGKMFGVLIAVWAPVITTLHDKLDPTIYGLSLAYLGGVAAYSTYLRSKSGTTPQIEPKPEKP